MGATVGRWISPDPSGLNAVDITNPQSWNRYACVINSPLANVDPSGLACYGIEIKLTGSCGAFLGNGIQWGGSWNEFTTITSTTLVGFTNQVSLIGFDDAGGLIPIPLSADAVYDSDTTFVSLSLGFDSTGGATNTGPNNVSCNSTTGICAPSSITKPRPAGCGAAVAQGAISVGLDVLGAIPGLGNAVSATAAGARAVNGIVAYGGAAYGIATGLPDEAPYGAASAGAGLGLTLADAALEGGKVIPVLGNFLSVGIGAYDGYQLAKTIQRCW